MTESAITFRCGADSLVGLLHLGESPGRRGVLFIVGGGPQYRVGGHRQLTLWSRHLSGQGFPVLRFDYRGMGDSHGEFRGFQQINEDIRAAVDHFFKLVPQMDEVVLWGECDAASAILFYAHRDSRVKGAVLLNPWVRTEAGAARTILRFYYFRRLLEPSFWAKVFSLRFNPLTSAASALRTLRQARAPQVGMGTTNDATADIAVDDKSAERLPLPERMLAGLKRLQVPMLLVLGGRDLIAREFDLLVSGSAAWRQELGRATITRHDLPDADHTFSSEVQRNQVADWGLSWLRSW